MKGGLDSREKDGLFGAAVLFQHEIVLVQTLTIPPSLLRTVAKSVHRIDGWGKPHPCVAARARTARGKLLRESAAFITAAAPSACSPFWMKRSIRAICHTMLDELHHPSVVHIVEGTTTQYPQSGPSRGPSRVRIIHSMDNLWTSFGKPVCPAAYSLYSFRLRLPVACPPRRCRATR